MYYPNVCRAIKARWTKKEIVYYERENIYEKEWHYFKICKSMWLKQKIYL